MESNLFEALKLMIVGMCTVFIVLVIIIEGGKLLIKCVNKLAKEDVPAASETQSSSEISPSVAKAINAAVNTMTNGNAHVVGIEKM